ncbi:MAG TPA: sulfur oxidation c-type cytochrome SoxX [Methylomirabilota bacterium]|nr:sulfur oxidation c-type cytochrome SoxX [Methylomirabilota bacterium]
MTPRRRTRWLVTGAIVAAVVSAAAGGDAQSEPQRTVEIMKKSFKARGQAGLDRLDQDEAQAACSRRPADGPVPVGVAERIAKTSVASVKFPADGRLMGDWREGEKIAQSGIGMQFSDDPGRVAGGNCYACHELSPRELSFGTIGPSLRAFGKIRGSGPEMQRYVYVKVYNSQAFVACSTMPRFGHKDILSVAQITHLVALLLDPASPVNQ